MPRKYKMTCCPTKSLGLIAPVAAAMIAGVVLGMWIGRSSSSGELKAAEERALAAGDELAVLREWLTPDGMAEALGQNSKGNTMMAFSKSWHAALHPVASVGYRPSPKYHLEMIVGLPHEYRDEGWDRSLTVMLGLFFWMGKEKS